MIVSVRDGDAGVAAGVYVTEHVADAPLPLRLQLLLLLKAPLPPLKLTLPEGGVVEPDVSVTVAVHDVVPEPLAPGPLLTVVGLQLTEVVVGATTKFTVTVVEPLLVAWTGSPPYVAVIVSVRDGDAGVAAGVYVTEHVAVAPLPLRLQLPLLLNVPLPPLKPTLPEGVIGEPDVSVTVAVHDVVPEPLAPLLTVVGLQLTEVVVGATTKSTVTGVIPLLVAWPGSPPYVAVSVSVRDGDAGVAAGVYVTEHVADAPLPLRLQLLLLLKAPLPPLKLTLPEGEVGEPFVSVTVAVQDVVPAPLAPGPLLTVVGLQLTAVVVGAGVKLIFTDGDALLLVAEPPEGTKSEPPPPPPPALTLLKALPPPPPP